MHLTKLKLTGINLDTFINFIIEQIEFDYENHSEKMTVLVKEEKSFRHQYYQVNIVTVKEATDCLLLDINSNGIEGRIVDYFVKSEEHFALDFVRILLKNCKELNFRIEKIN